MTEENASLEEIKPALIVEGVLCNKIESMTGALECLRAPDLLGMDPMTNVRTTYHIMRIEVQEMVDLLKPYNQASLAPKHRLARRLFKKFLKHMQENDVMNAKLKTANDPVCLAFATEAVRFIKAFHEVMLERNSAKKRTATTQVYCAANH